MPPCGIAPFPVIRQPWNDAQRTFFLSQANVQQAIATGDLPDLWSGGKDTSGTFDGVVAAWRDGMLPQSADGWEAYTAWQVASLRERIVGASPGAAAWWGIVVDRWDMPETIGQSVATLRDQGQITATQAQEFAAAANCLGLPVTLDFATDGSPPVQDRPVQDRIVVSATVQNPDGSAEAIGSDDPRFAEAVAALPALPDFGAGEVTRTVATTDGETVTLTSVPAGPPPPTPAGPDPTASAPAPALLLDASGSPLVPVSTELNRVVEFGPVVGATRPVDQIPAEDIPDPRDALPMVVTAGKWLLGIAIGGGAIWALTRSSKGRRR